LSGWFGAAIRTAVKAASTPTRSTWSMTPTLCVNCSTHQLVDAGIDSIVDLTTPLDPLEPYLKQLRAVADKAGHEVRHFSHPIPDNGVIDHDGYDEILALIRDEMSSGRVVYLHCWGGKGRTSTVVGCLLIIYEGLDYDSAIARITELRAGTRKAIDPCPESLSQHRVLRERAARRRRS
jgi:protein-tyrosine phosphatase